MVSLSEVSKSYLNQARVLDHIGMELKKGEFIYVVGGSGAGKSSLLRLIATEEIPTSGQISLFGYPLNQASGSALQSIRRALGYVPQDVRLIPDLSVWDNIALSTSLSGRGSQASHVRIKELLEQLGLFHLARQSARKLSGGEAQRVAVARALARSPELIVADEPTGAQDRDYTWLLMDLLLKANAAGSTVIVATHDREIVRRVRKRCAVLKDGRLRIEEVLCTY